MSKGIRRYMTKNNAWVLSRTDNIKASLSIQQQLLLLLLLLLQCMDAVQNWRYQSVTVNTTTTTTTTTLSVIGVGVRLAVCLKGGKNWKIAFWGLRNQYAPKT